MDFSKTPKLNNIKECILYQRKQFHIYFLHSAFWIFIQVYVNFIQLKYLLLHLVYHHYNDHYDSLLHFGSNVIVTPSVTASARDFRKLKNTNLDWPTNV
jgi:hypothetical protein